MKRLKKTNSRPRENRKSVEFLLSIQLDVDNRDGDSNEDLKKFKQWVVNTFTRWDKSILEHFLYQYQLFQGEDGDKYYLDFKVENIIKDDTTGNQEPEVEENLLKKKKEKEKEK